jgi:hypothetical protein
MTDQDQSTRILGQQFCGHLRDAGLGGDIGDNTGQGFTGQNGCHTCPNKVIRHKAGDQKNSGHWGTFENGAAQVGRPSQQEYQRLVRQLSA